MTQTFCFTQEAPKEAEKILDKKARCELVIPLMNELKFNRTYEVKFEKRIERGTWGEGKRYTYNLRLKEKEYEEPHLYWPEF